MCCRRRHSEWRLPCWGPSAGFTWAEDRGLQAGLHGSRVDAHPFPLHPGEFCLRTPGGTLIFSECELASVLHTPDLATLITTALSFLCFFFFLQKFQTQVLGLRETTGVREGAAWMELKR